MSEPNANDIDILFALALLADAWADAKPRQVLMLAIAQITEQRSTITEQQSQITQLEQDLERAVLELTEPKQ